MQKILTIGLCNSYHKEALQVLKNKEWDDVAIIELPSSCNKCIYRNAEAIERFHESYTKVDASFHVLSPFDSKDKNSHKINLCHNLLISEDFVLQQISQGSYILTPGWLKKWRNIVISEWGFDDNTAKEFFAESAKKLVLLNSGVYEDIIDDLKEMSAFVGLDYQVIDVGLEFFQNKIICIYQKWKMELLEQDNKEKNMQLGDFILEHELISEITLSNSIERAIESIFNIFINITASTKMSFVQVIENTFSTLTFFNKIEYKTNLLNLDINNFHKDVITNENQSGFIMKISIEDDILGFLEIEDIPFRKHTDKYISICVIIAKIFAMSLQNAIQYQKLIDAKKLAEDANLTKSHFLASMSHDIKTPINGIMGFLQLLKITNIDDEQEEYINDAMSSSELLLHLINDILDFSKIEAGKLTFENIPFNLHAAVSDNVSFFYPRAKEKNNTLQTIIKPSVPEEVIGDPIRLKQILNNLIGNALKFTENGEVSVTVDCISYECIMDCHGEKNCADFECDQSQGEKRYADGECDESQSEKRCYDRVSDESQSNCISKESYTFCDSDESQSEKICAAFDSDESQCDCINKESHVAILKFEIKDSGIGISEENISHLFQPFNQANATINRRFGGTGLGLSICKELVEIMGGNIYVESKIGEGATFVFHIRLLIPPPL